MNSKQPKYKGVTIGIPVYNEIQFIEKSIRSAINQAEYILISDNGSSDGTTNICQRYALEYQNVYLSRQDNNLGAFFNFKFLLEKCQTEYFMWLGAHDQLPDNYVELLKSHLESDKEAVLAYGNARRINLEDNSTRFVHCYPELRSALESSSPDRRALTIVASLNDCSLLHGLWKTTSLRQAWVDEQMIGGDHVLLLGAALTGKFRYVKETEYGRGEPVRDHAKAEQIARITGGSAREVSYKELCILSLNAIGESSLLRFPKLTHFSAYLILVWRFGAFSQNRIVRLFEAVLYKLSRVVKMIKIKLSKIL